MPRHDDLCDDDFCGGYTGGGYAGTSDIFEAISHTGGQDRPTGTNPGPFIRANHQEGTGFDQELIDHSEKIVDLVIVMDCTGSMGSEIEIAKQTVTVIMTTLHEHFQTDLRFAAISYRDHTDSYAVKEYPFTKDVEKAKSYIQEFSAEGGGDHPEALCSALKVLSEMPFNKKGKKLVVWIGDAPPHGMKSGSDSYPEGCKDEQGNVIDWVKLGSALQEKNVIFYTIICERAKDDQQLTLFMDYLATKTDGKCLLLTDAKKVPNLIINGCIEDDEMEKLIAKKIEELGEQTKNMKIDDLMQQVHEMTSKEKVAQVQTYVVASTKTKDLMKYTSMSDYDDNDMYCNASNNVTKDGCENEFDDFSYGEVNYYAPTKEKVTKAFLRNTRK